jgi:hypothetical protein
MWEGKKWRKGRRKKLIKSHTKKEKSDKIKEKTIKKEKK